MDACVHVGDGQGEQLGAHVVGRVRGRASVKEGYIVAEALRGAKPGRGRERGEVNDSRQGGKGSGLYCTEIEMVGRPQTFQYGKGVKAAF